jgi:hypothetical protein
VSRQLAPVSGPTGQGVLRHVDGSSLAVGEEVRAITVLRAIVGLYQLRSFLRQITKLAHDGLSSDAKILVSESHCPAHLIFRHSAKNSRAFRELQPLHHATSNGIRMLVQV